MAKQEEIYQLQTPFGVLEGKNDGRAIRFGSIRYAISERFQKPTAVSPEIAFRNIIEKPLACPQKIYPLIEKMIEKSNPDRFEVMESNQYLSVTVPKNFLKNEKLPVVVWIHGGSYEIGCGELSTTNPAKWVQEQEIIVVSISYRLGIFGFLGNSDERPPNLGLFDMIEALKWVKNYVEIFNGDSDNITLLGQSSGGDAAAHLMIADLPEKLFNRVIIQSAPLLFRKNKSKMIADFANSTEFLLAENDAMKIVDIDEKLIPTFRKFGWKALMPFGLQYGKSPLPKEEDADKIWRQKAKEYDVLIGFNSDETSFYIATNENFEKYRKHRISKHVVQKMIQYSTNKIYGKPSRDFVKNLKKGGGKPTHFVIQSREKFNNLGISHCFDLALLFGDEQTWKNANLVQDIPWDFLEENGSKIRSAWTEFIKTGQIKNSNFPEILHITH